MAKVGIWAGEFQDPSEFRHQNRRKTADRREQTGEPAGRHVCACPDDKDRAGRRCGRRNSHIRQGGKASVCDAAR